MKKYSDEEIQAALDDLVDRGLLAKLYADNGEVYYRDVRCLTPGEQQQVEAQRDAKRERQGGKGND